MPHARAELNGAHESGHLVVHAGDRSLDELLSIAAAASRAGRPLDLTGTQSRSVEDLMRIAVAGGTYVSFRSDRQSPDASPRPRRRWFFGAAP